PASFTGRGAPEDFSAAPISPLQEWTILAQKPERARFGARLRPRSDLSSAPAVAAVRASELLGRKSDVVSQHDVRAANLDVAAHLQVLHDPAYHLARGADHLRDVLLGQALGDHLLALDVLGHVEEQPGDAP